MARRRKKEGGEREKKKGRGKRKEKKKEREKERFATGSPHQSAPSRRRHDERDRRLACLGAERACSSPQPANATGVGRFERFPIAAAPRRRSEKRWSLGMTAASSCPQPLYGHTNVPVRERRGALRQRPCSATDRSNPPKQGPAARSYISSNGTRTSTVPYTYVGVVVTVPLLAPAPSATIGGRCRAARGRTLDTAAARGRTLNVLSGPASLQAGSS